MKSHGDQLLDAYVAAGCPVEHGWRGWVGLAYIAVVVLVVVGFVAMLITLFPIMIHVPGVSTPVAEWTTEPMKGYDE